MKGIVQQSVTTMQAALHESEVKVQNALYVALHESEVKVHNTLHAAHDLARDNHSLV